MNFKTCYSAVRNMEQITRKILFLLALFFGAMALLSIESHLGQLYTSRCARSLENQYAKRALGNVLQKQFLHIEDDLTDIALHGIVADNDHHQSIAACLDRIKATEQVLAVLSNGGEYQHVMPTNFEWVDEFRETITYQKPANEGIVIEVVELVPKLVDLQQSAEKFADAVRQRLAAVSDEDRRRYADAIMFHHMTLRAILLRCREDANKIYYDTNEQCIAIAQVSKETAARFWMAQCLTAAILGVVCLFVGTVTVRQIVHILQERRQIHSDLRRHRDNLDELVKERTDELTRLTRQHQLILHTAGEGIYGLTRHGQTTFVNPAAATMLGWEFDELIGKLHHEVVHHTRADGSPYPVQECPIQATLRDGVEHRVRNEVFWRKDGTHFPVSYISMPILEQGTVIGAVVTFQDITESRRAEKEREELNRQLMAASRQAGMAEVATGVLHNVGNVLNSVNVSSGLLADRLRGLKIDSLAKATELLQQHKNNLGEFVNNDEKGQHLPDFLHTIARVLSTEQQTMLQEVQSLVQNIEHIKEIVTTQQEYSKVCGVVEQVRLPDLINDAMHINNAGLDQHNVHVTYEYGDVPPITVDKHKALQVIINLISNAKQAMDHVAGRPELTLRLRMSPEVAGYVQIQVIDNGVGIAREKLQQVFAHGFTTRKDGHGFGLHSGALAAKEMGGRLIAESDGPGCGAVFTLELPITAHKKTPAKADA